MHTKSTFPKSAITILVVLNLMLIALVVYFLSNQRQNNILQADRINIQDASGENRVVISNQQHIPPPIIAGKTFERRVRPAGLIFYDAQGDERGGIAISKNGKTNINAIALDYQNADAIGIMAIDEDESDYFKAGLIINDKDTSGKPGANVNRINLTTENGNAALVINDAQEVPRLILQVDSLGVPSVQLLDRDGQIRKTIALD